MADSRQAPDRSPLLDARDLARRLGVKVRYVYQLVAERRVPYIKLGHLLRFDPDAIDEWIDSARVDQLWPRREPSQRRLT